MKGRTWLPVLLALLVVIGWNEVAWAARISELNETGFWERAARFFSFRDPSLRYALVGSLLLGICCGLMGAFLVVRKLSLMSDALSHAVLPGVALGFLWNMTKDPVAIFIGAVLAGLLGAGVMQAIQQTTRQKEDAALGFVLAAFYAVGICLMTMIQAMPGGNKSGLDSYLFGQAAALGQEDVLLLLGVTVLAAGVIGIFYKEFLVTSFDPGFARAAGLPARFFHSLLMLMLAFAIVASLQAVGVILVAAMLVIPAATAYLLTDRLGWMLVIASAIAAVGAAAGHLGARVIPPAIGFESTTTSGAMATAVGVIFVLVWVISPRHGLLRRWFARIDEAEPAPAA